MQEGQSYLSLPLHCTLARFATGKPADEVLAKAWPVFAGAEAVVLRCGKPSRFGSGKKPRTVEVSLVEKTPGLDSLQMGLYDKLNQLGVEYSNPGYVGEAYRPHISKRGGEAAHENTEIMSHAVYFIEIQPSSRTSSYKLIHARMPLGRSA